MLNIAATDELVLGNIYMVEMKDGEEESFRVVSETPTHYILSFTKGEQIEVIDKAKKDIIGIYHVKDWLKERVK